MTASLSLRCPADILAAVPYMLGFHPAKSLVVLGLRGAALVFQLRGDLPGHGEVEDFAAYYARLVRRQRVDAAILVGYGEGDAVTPVLTQTGRMLARQGIPVPEMLRAEDGRFWSYVCTSAECCPPEGTPYDVSSSEVAAAATLSGCVVLPSRADLERRLAPLEGSARAAMREATECAARRLAILLNDEDGEGLGDLAPLGLAAVDTALVRYAEGGRLSDEDVAWLSVMLGHLPVRDHAWWRIDAMDTPARLAPHIALWLDVLRRAEPELAAPPASLLGFAAWRAGEGAVASIAVARALEADPDYPMAQLLDQALRHGLSPEEWEAECDPTRLRTRSAPQ